MAENEIPHVLETGKAADVKNPILGKLKDGADDDDSAAEYIALKDGNGFNKHIMVYGATGAGKSRGFVKPFILKTAELGQSMILVDPKAEFFESMSGYLEDRGYTVRAFNLLDMENSDGWNCLVETSDNPNMVQTVAEVIMRNTSNPNEGAKQDFWQLAEINLLMALMHYVQTLTYEGTDELLPIHERSLGTIYKILAEENILTLDNKIKTLSKGHAARAPYGIFRQAAHQLWGNIAIGLGSRLNVFQNPLVDKITKYSDIDLALPGQKPCAYFCIISAQDSSLEFLSSLFFSLLLQRLSNYARTDGTNGRLPVEVNFMLEEFCNVGKILDFKKSLAMVRSYGINCQLVVQSLAALAGRYPVKEWNEIVNNCDTQLFLGCSDEMTAEFISRRCGVITVQLTNSMAPQTPLFSPITNAHSARYSETKSNFSRPLMYPDEIYRLDNRESLILIRGHKPLKAFKIIPDELPGFDKLRYVKSADYIPAWRKYEEELAAARIESGMADTEYEAEGRQLDMSSVDIPGDITESSAPEPEVFGTPLDTRTPKRHGFAPGEIDKILKGGM
jgi:type IV secretion system protein VirD4